MKKCCHNACSGSRTWANVKSSFGTALLLNVISKLIAKDVPGFLMTLDLWFLWSFLDYSRNDLAELVGLRTCYDEQFRDVEYR